MLLFLTFQTEEDRDTFEYLYNHYKRLCLHKATEILRDPMLAEDAVSEAYLRLYKNIHKVGDPTDNRSVSFLMTILRNTALTLLAREKKQPLEFPEEERADDFDLEGHILSELSSEGILALVYGLGDELRSVFLLRFGQDLSHREIAGILGITENNVTVRLHRARKKLAVLLREGGYAANAE